MPRTTGRPSGPNSEAIEARTMHNRKPSSFHGSVSGHTHLEPDIIDRGESKHKSKPDVLDRGESKHGSGSDIWDRGESIPRVYVPPPQANVSSTGGKRFNISKFLVNYMDLPPKVFFTLNHQTVRDFVFVTSIDTTHFEEIKDCVASIQLHFPGYPIHFYDVGLKPEERSEARSWCGVTLHHMDLSVFPDFISRNLHEKCWKYLVIQEAIRNVHDAIFWVDASFRALQPISEWGAIFDQAVNNGGMVLTTVANAKTITNFAYVEPRMYAYLPTNTEMQKTVTQACSCSALIYNTEFIYRNVLHWVYLCSLESGCCEFSKEVRTEHLERFKNLTEDDISNPAVYKSTRYDQAMVNLLLSNVHGYNLSAYGQPILHSLHAIMRYATHDYNVTKC